MDALTLLSLQIDWGADEALTEMLVNRLEARRLPPAPPARAPGPTGTVAEASRPPAAQQPAVSNAGTLDELCATIRNFTGCGLRDTATHTVLPEGDPAGGLLVIGEPPGAEDDRSGRPFSGPAGAVLDKILGALGLGRDKILLAPLIPWRPPGNRPPTDAELGQCLPFLYRLIVLTAPRHIVLTGILPVRALLGGAITLRRVRGNWMDLHIAGLAAPVSILPSAGLGSLKTATERRDAWADWRMLHRTIHGQS